MGKRAYLLLALLFAVMAVTNHFWLSYDRVPPDWDEAEHMMSALNHHRILGDFAREPDFSPHGIKEVLRRLVHVDSFVYPPLVTFMGGLLMFIGDKSTHTVAMINIVFLAILIVSVFQIGKKMGDEKIGLLSVLLVLLYPVVFGLARMPMLDFALLAMTALSVCLLLHSEFFTRRGYTILFGISLGLGMLTKPVFMTNMLIPVAYVVGHCLLRFIRGEMPAKALRDRALWALGALIVGVLIAALWYGPHAHRMGGLRRIAATELWGLEPYSIEANLYYLHLLIVRHIGLPFFILFVYGVCRLRGSVTRFNAGLLLLWMVGLYVMLTVVPQKTVRQSLGLLLPISVISAIGLRRATRYRTVLTIVVLLYGVTQFAALSLPRPMLADRVGEFRWAGHYVFGRPPENGNWRLADTVRGMDSQVRKIGIVSDHPFVNGQTFAYFGKAMQSPFEIIKCRDRHEDFLENLAAYDVVITKSDWVPIVQRANPNIDANTNAILLEHFQNNIDRFDLAEKKPLPDGSDLLIYRQKPSVAAARPPSSN